MFNPWADSLDSLLRWRWKVKKFSCLALLLLWLFHWQKIYRDFTTSDNKTPRGLWAVTRDIYCIKKSVLYFLTFLLRMWKDSIACYPSVNIVKSSLLVSNRSFVYKHCRLGTSANQGSKNKMFANSWDKFSAAWKVVLFLSNSSEKRREIQGQNNVRDFFYQEILLWQQYILSVVQPAASSMVINQTGSCKIVPIVDIFYRYVSFSCITFSMKISYRFSPIS